MYFAPQRRALFRHLNFQKWSEPLVFLTCWLRNVLRATTPCTFSSSQFPKLLRTPQFLTHFTSKRRALFQHLNFQKWSDAEVFCAFSLPNRLRATTACNFSSLISPDVSAPAALASLLFDPPEPQNHEKTQCFATFLPFRAPASSFFWSFLFWLFSLLTAFSSLHIVGSLTPKLPSINIYQFLYHTGSVVFVMFVSIWQHMATPFATSPPSSSREFFHSNALICFPVAAKVVIGIWIQTLTAADRCWLLLTHLVLDLSQMLSILLQSAPW